MPGEQAWAASLDGHFLGRSPSETVTSWLGHFITGIRIPAPGRVSNGWGILGLTLISVATSPSILALLPEAMLHQDASFGSTGLLHCARELILCSPRRARVGSMGQEHTALFLEAFHANVRLINSAQWKDHPFD